MRKEKSRLGFSWVQSGAAGALQVNFTFPCWVGFVLCFTEGFWEGCEHYCCLPEPSQFGWVPFRLLLIKYLGPFCDELSVYQLQPHQISAVGCKQGFFPCYDLEEELDNICFIHAGERPRYNWLRISLLVNIGTQKYCHCSEKPCGNTKTPFKSSWFSLIVCWLFLFFFFSLNGGEEGQSIRMTWWLSCHFSASLCYVDYASPYKKGSGDC